MLFCLRKPGVGTPILFIHGFLGSHRDFESILSHIPNPTLAIDLYGHGNSKLPDDFSWQKLLDSIASLLKERVHIVGYSMGGRVALMFKYSYPHLVQKVVLIGAHPGLKKPSTRDAFEAKWLKKLRSLSIHSFIKEWYAQPLFAPDISQEILQRRLLNCMPSLAKVFETLSLASQKDLTGMIENDPKNFLLIAGERDHKYVKLYSQIAKNRLKTIPHVGHSVHIKAPFQLLGYIMDHIQDAPASWTVAKTYQDILYTKRNGIAKISINRPHLHNAFRPQTVREMINALLDAKWDESIGVIILTGEGGKAFCSGGDQSVRKEAGYSDEEGHQSLNVLEFQKLLRSCPKPTIAMVAGYAIGGGHVLHVLCDLTIAADNAIFGQTGPKVGSFDGGFGASYLASIVGEKKAREIWYLCRQYNAKEALNMGLVNQVVPLEDLEDATLLIAEEMLKHSPLALRCLKSSFNAALDGQAGIQELAGNATMLFYMSDEAKEGHRAFLEKRPPNFSKFKKRG